MIYKIIYIYLMIYKIIYICKTLAKIFLGEMALIKAKSTKEWLRISPLFQI